MTKKLKDLLISLSIEEYSEILENIVIDSIHKVLDTHNVKDVGTEEGIIDDEELTKKLKITRQTSYSWRKSGKIRYRTIGGRIYYLWSEVLEDTKLNDLSKSKRK